VVLGCEWRICGRIFIGGGWLEAECKAREGRAGETEQRAMHLAKAPGRGMQLATRQQGGLESDLIFFPNGNLQPQDCFCFSGAGLRLWLPAAVFGLVKCHLRVTRFLIFLDKELGS
jgi:hypothetical protein